MSKKIVIKKNDDIGSVIEAIERAKDTELILVIPKESKLKGSVAYFKALQGAAGALGKKVVLESVDEDLVNLALENGVEASHPLFTKAGSDERQFSDIVPKPPGRDASRSASTASRVVAEKIDKPTDSVPIDKTPLEPVGRVERSTVPSPRVTTGLESRKEASEKVRIRIRFPKPSLRFLIIAGIVVVLGGGGWFLARAVSTATIVITMNKTPWEYSGEFVADTTIKAVDAEKGRIPGQIFVDEKNTTKLFPASGRKNLNEKAQGTITIYNAFSSAPQELVATTRFVAPDGKTFRLNSAVTIPGANVKGGEITPASIDAPITADQAGADYNVTSVARLTIPGFAGTPKFDGFYGSITKPTTGGHFGEKPVPTKEDIAAAKKSVEDTLRAALNSNILTRLPDDFQIVDELPEITLGNIIVNESTDATGNFSAFGKGELRALGFKKSDLAAALLSIAGQTQGNKQFRDLKVDFSKVKSDLRNETLLFTVSATGNLEEPLDVAAFKKTIAGMRIGEIQPLIRKIPGVGVANVSLKPFWVFWAPSNSDRIKITVQ